MFYQKLLFLLRLNQLLRILLFTAQEVKEGQQLKYFILKNNLDTRTKQTNAYLESELQHYQKHLLNTIIHRSEVINQARITNEPIQVFAPKSKSTKEYQELNKEIIRLVK